MDYKELLIKYMAVVINNESIDYIDYIDSIFAEYISKEEKQELIEISKEAHKLAGYE